MSAPSSSSSTTFLALPDKAVKQTLSYLNAWNLMNLRLVCKTTKSWVEDPSILKKLAVHVKERRFIKDLIKSKVQWSNIVVECDCDDMTNSWIQHEHYKNLFRHLKSSLRILRFTEQRVPFKYGLEWIICECENLEELYIGTLNLKQTTLPIADEAMRNLSGLRTFVVNYVAWEKEEDLQFFPRVFEEFTNLNYLKLPYVLSATMYSLYPTLDEDEVDQKLLSIMNEVLFKPVLKLLEREEKSSLKFIDVESFELEQLLETLAPACQKSGALLMNVLEAFERPVSEKETSVCTTIGSLFNCSKYLDLTSLTKLESISITDDFVESSDIDKKFEHAALPALKTVKITLTKSILRSERLASCFLQQKRERVEEVHVKFDDLKGSAQASVFRSPKFANSFPNLRSLSLNGFDGKPEDYQLFWKSFPLLETLQLENCRTLNDLALLGTDPERAFMNLKNLTRLTIDYGDVSDLAVEQVVSKLPLEVLVLCLPKVTMNGLSTLKCGPMVSSLMMLNCMKPDDASEDDMKVFFQAFQNLKRSEILF